MSARGIAARTSTGGLAVAEVPARGAAVDVVDRVEDAFRDEVFVARFDFMGFSVHQESQAPFDHRHQLVRVVHEVVPLAPGRIDERLAGEAARLCIKPTPPALPFASWCKLPPVEASGGRGPSTVS